MMSRKNKKPKSANSIVLSRLSQSINPGEYVLYGSSDPPEGIPSGGSNCRAIVIAASTMGSTSLPHIHESISPTGDVYLVRYFRIYSGSSTPRKVDDVLYWNDQAGNPWSIHSKESPDHHFNIMSSTGLGGLINDLDLPSAFRGSLEEYREAGAHLDFVGPFVDD